MENIDERLLEIYAGKFVGVTSTDGAQVITYGDSLQEVIKSLNKFSLSCGFLEYFSNKKDKEMNIPIYLS